MTAPATSVAPQLCPATSQRIARTAAGLCCLILVPLVWLGCEPGPAVDYTNQTALTVTVYEGGEFVFELQPGETRGVAGLKKDWIEEIMVVSSDGTILLDETITWEQVESMDHRIVITEPG